MQGAENLATLMGPVLAGVGVALLGSGTVYALNAVSFLVSAVLLVRIGNRLQSQRRCRGSAARTGARCEPGSRSSATTATSRRSS